MSYDQLFLLQQATGSSASTLDMQLVPFFLKGRTGNSGGESSGRMDRRFRASAWLDSSSSSAIFLFLRPFFSLSALQAGEISKISSTIRLQFSKYSFSLSWKEVSFRWIPLRTLGLIRILVTPDSSVHSWYRSLNFSLTDRRKMWMEASGGISLSDFLEQQAQKRRQACRFRMRPLGFSDSQIWTKDLNSSAFPSRDFRSYCHLVSSRTYSRKSSSKRFMSSFLARAQSSLSTKKVRKTWSFLSRRLWQQTTDILWMTSRTRSSKLYFSYSRHSCAQRWTGSTIGSGSGLGRSGSWKFWKRLVGARWEYS